MARPIQPTFADRLQRIRLPQLEAALLATDPAAILTPPRILRRVIKQVAEVGGIGLRVPHRKTFVVSRAQLLTIVDPLELDLGPGVELLDTVILLARPTPESLTEQVAGDVLVKFWRLLFHARIHVALDQALLTGRLSLATIRERIAGLGRTEFNEIRNVLKQEEFLLPPRDEAAAYLEFVAVYLELRYFAPALVAIYFPSIQDWQHVDQLVKQDVDADGLFDATRLPEAPRPSRLDESLLDSDDDLLAHEMGLPPHANPSPRTYRLLVRRADKAAAVGNLVRAAILRTRAARHVEAKTARRTRADAWADLDRLAVRLLHALGFKRSETDDWARSLISLLDQSSRGFWTPEARMLYDLQKVCVDHERGVYALDVWRWMISFGRTPLKRMLPGQRDVLVTKHLRGAVARLPAVRVAGHARKRLSAILRSAADRAEGQLRSRFQPLIESALDQVGLVPQNLPEAVARMKLIEELLDRVIERGFLSMGDLRDALSRNNLKLPDFTSFKQLIVGDQLLQADRRLARNLDGVYRKGEIYLRWSQRLSSLAFGTPVGRFLTRYVVLPFGGSFVALEGLQHLTHMIAGWCGYEPWHLNSWSAVAGLGVFFLGLIYHDGFRQVCVTSLRAVGRGLKRVLVDFPNWLGQLPAVQAVLRSLYYRLLVRYLIKPLVVSAVAAAALIFIFNRQTTLESSLGIFLAVNLLLNSRIGRSVDEMVTDWLVNAWHKFRIHVVTAVLRLIVDVFNRILKTVERLLYAVDELLRFRTGEHAWATACKIVLGVIWFFIAYLVRLYVNLLIEPQLNPVKHFPVVTVSHKVILPMSKQLIQLMAAPLMPLGAVWANTIAAANVFLLPGVFGFLVWELKENWRLYAANRPRRLGPVQIGHHGETMLQLMKPGFHSGTLPKLYARLRRANRVAQATGDRKAVGKQGDALHRVEEHVRRFVDRELLLLVRQSQGWGRTSIATGEIHLATDRILIELYAPELGEDSLWLAFEERAGWLLADVRSPGWLPQITGVQQQTLGNALAGFYKMAGVDLAVQQIEFAMRGDSGNWACGIRSDRVSYEITEQGLATNSSRGERFFTLAADARRGGLGARGLAPTDAERQKYIFAANSIAWSHWVWIWNLDSAGKADTQAAIDGVRLL